MTANPDSRTPNPESPGPSPEPRIANLDSPSLSALPAQHHSPLPGLTGGSRTAPTRNPRPRANPVPPPPSPSDFWSPRDSRGLSDLRNPRDSIGVHEVGRKSDLLNQEGNQGARKVPRRALLPVVKSGVKPKNTARGRAFGPCLPC